MLRIMIESIYRGNAMENNELLEPVKYYESQLKQIHHENVESLFDELTKKSGIDVEANRQTMKKYHAKEEELNHAQKALNKMKALKVILIVLGVLALVGGIVMIGVAGGNNVGLLAGGIGASVAGVILIIVGALSNRKKIKDTQSVVDKIKAEMEVIKQEAEAQVAALNALFTPTMSTELIQKSAPIFEFDQSLEQKTMDRLVNQFNEKVDMSKDHSTLVVQSGQINNNPFMIRQVLEMEMQPETYTGTLLITWTETVSTENGTRTVTRTQTLVATHVEPKPHYAVATYLSYYNEAAPKLSFTRTPCGLSGKSDKDIDKYVAKFEKRDIKKSEKATKKGENYTHLTNSTFEAFLNGKDRDNEVEYRLMFTPLAQKNIEYLFKKNEPYGDDIYYGKYKCVNTIQSKHSQGMDYSGGTYNYYDFDYDQIAYKFKNYNETFFQGFYYDFLFILSIPIFTQNRSENYLGPYSEHEISTYELECMANKFDASHYQFEDGDTEKILKVKATKNGNVEITAHSFTEIPDVDIVMVMGGDGHMHGVPVNYFRYEPSSYVFNGKANTASLDNPQANEVNYKRYSMSLN